jgi:hypothetical protein
VSLSTLPIQASERLNPDLLRSVLRIETAPNAAGDFDIGTGFLVSTTNDSTGRVFLITNKHMIGDWNPVDQDIRNFHPFITVFYYREADPTGLSYRGSRVDIGNASRELDNANVHLHPSGSIDLVAIDVTDKLKEKDEHIVFLAYTPSYFVRFEKIHDYQTDIGDQVFALGYPLGIRSLHNNYPIAKLGDLASQPGQEVSIPFPALDRTKKPGTAVFTGKFLVVDGLIVPGNSGGPVTLVGGIRTRRDPKTNELQYTDKPIPNLVLGVVSCGLGPSGLTIVVSSDYVLELVESLSK